MFIMRVAESEDLPSVVRLYQAVAKDASGLLCKPQCLMEPVETAFLEQSISRNELFAGFWNDELVGSVVINHEPHPEFSQIAWSVDVPSSAVGIVHSLAVLPAYQELERQVLAYAVRWAKEHGMRTLRYDVLKSDIPLQHLIALAGFQLRGVATRRLSERRFYPYGMYELVL